MSQKLILFVTTLLFLILSIVFIVLFCDKKLRVEEMAPPKTVMVVLLAGMVRDFNKACHHLKSKIIQSGSEVHVHCALWDIYGYRIVQTRGDVRYDEKEFWSGTPTSIDTTPVDLELFQKNLDSLGATSTSWKVYDYESKSKEWLKLSENLSYNETHTQHQIISKHSMWFLRQEVFNMIVSITTDIVMLTRFDANYENPLVMVDRQTFQVAGVKYPLTDRTVLPCVTNNLKTSLVQHFPELLSKQAYDQLLYCYFRGDVWDDMYAVGPLNVVKKYCELYPKLTEYFKYLFTLKNTPLQSEDLITLHAALSEFSLQSLPMKLIKS
jgi:hypothetical protein